MDFLGFKQPKSLDDMISHLKKNKRVVFNIINESEAKDLIYTHNYINIISPFKHKFCKKEFGKIIKDNDGNHIYTRETEFMEYYNLYRLEREIYPDIYKNISSFETVFNSIISYEVFNIFNIFDILQFLVFIDVLRTNLNSYERDEIKKRHLLETINSIAARITTSKSIYILFDRLSLNETLTIFKLLGPTIKGDIFRELKNRNLTYGRNDISNFEKTISKLIIIRNYVCHSNSLEILKLYYNPNERILRTRSDYRQYSNLITLLSK